MAMLTRGLSIVCFSKSDVYPEISLFGVNVGDFPGESKPNLASVVRSDLVLLGGGHGYDVSWSLLTQDADTG